MSALTPDREQLKKQLKHWLEPPRQADEKGIPVAGFARIQRSEFLQTQLRSGGRFLPSACPRHQAATLPEFAPELSYGRHRGPATPSVRPAAVIAMFYPHADRWCLPLTLRTQHLSDHAGQVSFPGGGREPGETDRQCALRELSEELGVETEDVDVVGGLSPIFVYSSNYFVQPFVAVSGHRPAFRPDPLEVEQVLEVPVTHLLDATNYRSHIRRNGTITYQAPCVTFHGHHIWGATSVMLSELIGILREIMAGCPFSGGSQ